MKKFFVLIFISALLISCNSNTTTTQKTAPAETTAPARYNINLFNKDNVEICNEAGGFGNFFVSETDGMNMIKDFNRLYKIYGGKPVDALENSFWLSAPLINEMAVYLKTNKNDGIRVYMACDLNPDVIRYPAPFQNRSIIFLFPTNKDASISDPKISTHVTLRKSLMHKGVYATACPYIKDYAIISKMIGKFNNTYISKMNELSVSVWIDSCVINGLNTLLKDNAVTNDGVFINLAAYNSSYPRGRYGNDRKYDAQSTIILIPSKPDGASWHLPDWALTDSVTKKVAAYAPPGGFNHGELCPTKCD